VEGYRKFCNKVFNATKFAMLKLDESFRPEPTPKVRFHLASTVPSDFLIWQQPTGNESLVEQWILHKLNIAAAETNKQLSERNFMAATNAVYNFWLYELCDVYIVRRFFGCRISWVDSGTKSGSYETYDRLLCTSENPRLGPADALHMSRPWSATATPFHAIRDRGVVAAPLQAAK
jgi:isoleucyl-tRNA synthetase